MNDRTRKTTTTTTMTTVAAAKRAEIDEPGDGSCIERMD